LKEDARNEQKENENGLRLEDVELLLQNQLKLHLTPLQDQIQINQVAHSHSPSLSLPPSSYTKTPPLPHVQYVNHQSASSTPKPVQRKLSFEKEELKQEDLPDFDVYSVGKIDLQKKDKPNSTSYTSVLYSSTNKRKDVSLITHS
jgi:hypothetical protein